MRDRILGAVSLRGDATSQSPRQRRRRGVQVQELRELSASPEHVSTALQYPHRYGERDESAQWSSQYSRVR